MNPKPFLLAASFLAVLGVTSAFAITVEPLSHWERAERAGAVCRGTVESIESYRGEDGLIHTRAVIGVDEVFKGTIPSQLALEYRGGRLENEGETVFAGPHLETGEERVFFLASPAADRLVTVGGPAGAPAAGDTGAQPQGSGETSGVLREMRNRFPSPAEGADLSRFEAKQEELSEEETSSASTAHALASVAPENGLFQPPRRSPIPDRGEPMRYVVDLDALPDGISEEQALEAVENALAAWTGSSLVEFVFDGIESFGKAASEVAVSDGRLRIQLHDTYGAVGESVLGIGGHNFTWIDALEESGGTGGTVDGLGFHRVTRGYVVIDHTASTVEDPATFEATLCHEIGHALGLAHSSEDGDESDSHLREAIMYFTIHDDGRGATLNAWDEDAIALIHPTGSAPPYGFDRFLRAVTSPDPLEIPEVNEVAVDGYSLFGEDLTLEVIDSSSNNGSFARSGRVVAYSPDAPFSDSEALEPGSGQFFDQAHVRFDDGTHQSAAVAVRVVQFLLDTHSVGIPDSWREEHFGSAEPVEGHSGAGDDPDGDGFSNVQEYLLETDPLDGNSRFAVTEFDEESLRFHAKPYEVYELHESPDLESWAPTGAILQPTASEAEFALPTATESRQFYRVERVR